MNRKRISLSIIALIALTIISPSCKRTKYAKEIAHLDSLQTLLTETDSVLKSIDTVKINACYMEIKNNLNFIQENYKDTMAREMALFLSDYRTMQEAMEEINREQKHYVEELEYSEKQIENLIHDLQKNAIEEEKVREYSADEINVANEIISSVNYISGLAKQELIDFDQKNKRVLEMINELKQAEIAPTK